MESGECLRLLSLPTHSRLTGWCASHSTVRFTLDMMNAAHYIVYTEHNMMNASQDIMNAAHYNMDTAHYIMYTAHFIIYTAHY